MDAESDSTLPGTPTSGVAWHFSPEQLKLILLDSNSAKYSVDLRKITSSACMLDIIFDVSSKHWASSQLIGELVQQLRELFDPQLTLCGGGKDRKLDPVEYLHHHRVN